jgi:hypothetical protein
VCRPEELFCTPTDCWIWWSELVFIVVLSELIDNLYQLLTNRVLAYCLCTLIFDRT